MRCHSWTRHAADRWTGAVLAATLLLPAAARARPPEIARPCGPYSAVIGPDPYTITLVPTANANGASGSIRLRFAASPFVFAVTRDGQLSYDAALTTTGLAVAAGATPVAWAATPALDQVQKLGVIGEDGGLEARIAFNKFLVFVTAEPDATVERWSGPILLRGISPSARMHTMAGHGPFGGEPCRTILPF